MIGENPYAPPSAAEPEAPSTRYWHTYGTSLIVRNGATLPKIDLETGVSEGNLRPIQQIHQRSSAGGVMRPLILFALYVVLNNYIDIHGPSIFLCIFAGALILQRVSALRGSAADKVAIWTFTEERRAKRNALRRWIRVGSLVLILLTVFVIPSLGIQRYGSWIFIGYFCWIGLMLALAVWNLLDKPKFKLHSDKPGWLRITPLHPAALEKFHALENAELQLAASPAARKRLIRTVYYHRFPLRLLVGHRIHNPLVVLQCALMKLLRSRLLVRDAWHFSEELETTVENLNPLLRAAVESWQTAHPDWIFISGDHLASPAGDLIVENAVLASPGLAHIARINRAWMEQRAEKGITHFTFLTWLADGNHYSTHDQPYLALANPHLNQRVAGTPEQVWQAHLAKLSTLPVSPAADTAELRARILREKEQTDQLLTEKGLQSETREV